MITTQPQKPTIEDITNDIFAAEYMQQTQTKKEIAIQDLYFSYMVECYPSSHEEFEARLKILEDLN